MVAEPVVEAELPEVSEQEVPNPSETVVETPEVEVEEDFSDTLALLNEGSEAGGGTDTATEEEAPAPKTEAEIEAAVIQRLNAQGNKQYRDRQIEGMRNSFRDMKGDVTKIQAELDAAYAIGDTAKVLDAQRRLENRIDQHNGHWNELYHNDVLQAHTTGGDGVRKEVHQAVVERLGQAEYTDLMSKHQEWGTLMEDFAERYAKKQGWLPKSEAQKRFSDGQRDTLAKLKKLGIELPRGGEGERIPAPQGGSSRLPTFAAFSAMDITEQEKFTPEQRASIYASDARIRAR